MHGFFDIKILSKALCTAVALAAMGCQLPPPAVASPQPMPQPVAEIPSSRQMIIKFKPDTIMCDAAGIARLSLATEVALEYIRLMSGDACVIRQLADDASGFSQGQKTLEQYPAVEWLERDERMKAF